MLLASFRSDPARQEQGVWADIGDGARLLVASTNSQLFRKEMERLERVFRSRRNIITGDIPREDRERMLAEAMSRTILLGWEGLRNDDGSEIQYSADEALRIMTNPAYRPFTNKVSELAEDQARFRDEQTEAIIKNSSSASISSLQE